MARSLLVVLAATWSVLISFSAGGKSVRAQEERLRWIAPRGCVARKEMERRLAAAFATAPEPLDVRAHVSSWSRGYRLELTIVVGARTLVRRLHALDCGSLAESAALLVALAVADRRELPDAARSNPEAGALTRTVAADQGAPQGHSPPVEEGTPEEQSTHTGPNPDGASRARFESASAPQRVPQGAASGTADDKALPSPSRVRSSVLGLSVGAAAGVMAGALPKLAASLAGEVTLELLPLSFGVRLGNLFAGSQQLGADASLRYSARYLALRGCGEFALGGVVLGPCASLWLQRLDVSATGLGRRHHAQSDWLSLGMGALARTHLWRGIEAAVEAGALLPLSERPEVDVLELGEAAQVRPLVGYALLGLRHRFW